MQILIGFLSLDQIGNKNGWMGINVGRDSHCGKKRGNGMEAAGTNVPRT